MGIKVISLFDGMSCGQIAFRQLGIEVDQYDAWEIDKYATKVTNHNFPDTIQHGDVFSADFTQFKGRDWLVGGSPCTLWSIAQSPDKRETEASGIGWELFSQYVRCLREAQPKYFLYENNKSMAPAIRESITDTFGFEPICINSALVSAQNRNRLYWVGIRQEDGTYRKADIDQPTDRGILLKDVLDGVALSDKGHTVMASAGRTTTPREYLIKNQSDMVAEPLSEKEMDYMVRTTSKNRNHFEFGQTCDSTKNKSPCVTTGMGRLPYNVVVEPIGTNGTKSKTIKAQYNKNALLNFVSDSVRFGATGVAEPINQSSDGKSQCLRATYFKDGMRNIIGNDVDKKNTNIAEPVGAHIVGRHTTEDGKRHDIPEVPCTQRPEINDDPNKSRCLTTVSKDNVIIEPILSDTSCIRMVRTEEGKKLRKDYESGTIHHGFNEYRRPDIRGDGKSNCVTTVQKDNLVIEPICHTIPQTVCVHKYTCDLDAFKTLLRTHKTISAKDLAERLNKPKTLVEHWFRTDDCFAIPDADIWFELKEILNIQTNEYDDFVTVFETKDGSYDKANRCYDVEGKMSTIMTGQNDSIIEPINPTTEGKAHCLISGYYKASITNMSDAKGQDMSGVAESIPERIEVRGMKYELKDTSPDKNVCAHLNMPKHHDLLTRVYNTEGKAPTLVSNAGGNTEPKVFSSTMAVKSVSPVPTYIVKDGMIEYKGKKYPIKLRDGEYIIRKLTVSECKRLQTVPDWYDMSAISNSQAYKCLGNGWTIEVIMHLISSALSNISTLPSPTTSKPTQLTLEDFQ